MLSDVEFEAWGRIVRCESLAAHITEAGTVTMQ